MGKKKIVIYSEPMQETRADGSHGISGDAVNCAVSAKRLERVIADVSKNYDEAPVSILAALGRDNRGDHIVRFLQENGVDTSLIARIPDKKTAAYNIRLEGSSRIFNYDDREDAAMRYLFEDVNMEPVRRFIAQADRDTVLVISGIGASRPLNDLAFARLMDTIEQVKQKGGTVVVDANYRKKLWEEGNGVAEYRPELARERMTQLFEKADTVFFSWPDDNGSSDIRVPRVFPEWETTEDMRKALFSKGVRHLVAKEGAKRAVLYTNGGSGREVPIDPRFKVPVIDATGTGDQIMGATLMAMAHGMPIEDGLVVGMRAAAEGIQEHGGVLNRIPDEKKLKKDLAAFSSQQAWGAVVQPGAFRRQAGKRGNERT